MRRWRGINSFRLGLILLLVLVSDGMAQHPPSPQGPKLEETKPTADIPKVHITVTGKLIRVMAIGAETTGWAVDLDEPRQIGGKKVTRMEIDPAGSQVGDFENRRIEVVGILEKRSGVERGDYWAIVVQKIRGYSH